MMLLNSQKRKPVNKVKGLKQRFKQRKSKMCFDVASVVYFSVTFDIIFYQESIQCIGSSDFDAITGTNRFRVRHIRTSTAHIRKKQQATNSRITADSESIKLFSSCPSGL
jgi:hypothetical protein